MTETRKSWMVCPCCNGNGTVLNEAFRGVPVEYEDPEDLEYTMEMMNDGAFDVVCPTCKGLRVVEDSPEAEEARKADDEWDAEIRREAMMLGEW